MPFKTFVVGEELLADDVNTYLANQVVPTFTDAAQRTVQLPSPDKGQLSALDTHGGALWLWNGTAWQEPSSPRNTAGVNLRSQVGQDVVTTDSGGGGIVDYPVPFAAPALVIILQDMSSTYATKVMVTYSVVHDACTATRLVFHATNAAGSPIASSPVRVGWHAIGERAAGS